MSEYVEEYLVALGYDLKSEEGQEYLRMCQEMERRHEELVKSGKNLTDSFGEQSKAQQANISGDKEEAAQLAKLDDMYRQLHKTQAEETRVKPVASQQQVPGGTTAAPKPPAGPPTASPQAPKTPPSKAAAPQASGEMSGGQKKRIEGDREEINLLGDMEKTVRQIGVAWAQLERGNIFGAFTQSIKGAKQFSDMLDRAGSSAQVADKKSGNFKQTIADVLKTKGKPASGTAAKGAEVAKTAASGAEAAGAGADAGAAAAGAAGGPVGIVTVLAIAAAAEAMKKIADTVLDLTEGLAQTNVQIETMSRQLWISQSAAYQLNGTLKAMGRTTADLNEIALNPTLRQQFQDLQNYEKSMLQLPADFDAVNKQWGKDIDENGMKINAQLEHIKQMSGYTLEKLFDKPFQWVLDKIAGGLETIDNKMFGAGASQGTAANYAPQTSSYTQYQGATVTYSPHIEVTANSDKASDIAAATAEAIQQRFSESALMKNIQGQNR